MTYITEAIYAFFRGFGFFLLLFSFLQGLLFYDWRGILLGTYLLLSILINSFLKYICSLVMGSLGKRPAYAQDCGSFISKHTPPIIAKSYGMPSGHSQLFAMVATLIIISLIKKKDPYVSYKIILLVCFVFLAMFMRVYIEQCHTWLQTIIGTLIGISLGYFLARNIANPF